MKMKMTLATLAILGAFAGSAAAADVTLYGLVDYGFSYEHTDGDTAADANDSFQMKSGQNSGSRFGVKGAEDLGNGLKVGFVLENGFAGDSGTFSTTNKLFDREAQLNLSGAFGTIAFGRMGQLASANGSFGLLGQTSPFSSGWGDSIGQKFVTADGWTRFDNTITYATPDFAGFKVYAQYSLKNSSTEGGDEGKSSANRYYGIAATYKAENLYLVGIVDSINHGKQMYFGGTGYNYTYDADQLTVTLGGNYDFGVAKVYAMGQYFQNAIAVGQKYITDSSFGKFGYSFGDTAGWEGADGYGLALGVGVPVLGGTAKAHVGYMDAEAAEDSSRKLSRWNVAVGYDYSLSKRTSVYSAAAYTKDDNTDYSGLEPSSVEVIAGLIHRF